MNLVAGATGMLGGEICRLLVSRRKPVRALVRRTSSPEKIAELAALGAEIVYGDLKDPASLIPACRGAAAIISTASSTLSRQEGDSIESVDEQGQVNLVEAAEPCGVGQFVLISFPPMALDFPLQSAKRAAEARLRRGSIPYTILQPTFFMEVWLGPVLGFDIAGARVLVYGTGEQRISWISLHDVAGCAVASLDTPYTKNATVELGGPDALSPLDVVALAEEMFGRRIAVQFLPEAALREQYDSATTSLQKSFAGLMLAYAAGEAIDTSEMLRLFPGQHLRTVREYLQAAG